MGNHEYCTECGENDYHSGEPCDPKKKAVHQKEIQDREKRNQGGREKLEQFTTKLKKMFPEIEFETDDYGHTRITWYQFR